MEISDDLKIVEIKRIFAEINSIDLVNTKIRFLFGGSELLDDNLIYQYNLKDDYLVQVLKINML